VERELSALAESLLDLEGRRVAVLALFVFEVKGCMDDHVFLRGTIGDDEVPLLTLEEGEVGRVDIAWCLVFHELCVLDSEAESDGINHSDGLLVLSERFGANLDDWQRCNHLLELSKLSGIATEETQLGALFRTKAAEGLDRTLKDLVFFENAAVVLDFIHVEAR